MEKPKIIKVDPNEVAEVQRFLEIRSKLEEFKETHRPIFKQLEMLAEEYNTALEAADKKLRAQKVGSGPFDLFTILCNYDAELLHRELGEDDFLRVGGTIATQTVYSLNKEQFEAFVEAGQIPKEVVEVVKKETPRYHKPDKILLP